MILQYTHISCSDHFAPDLIQLVPAWNFSDSPRNITVECGWRPLFYTWGMNILDFYYSGVNNGFYEAGNDLHM